MRVFISAPLPQALADSALGLQRALRRRVPDGVKWTAPDQLHFTLHFLGEAEPSRVQELPRLLACASAKARFQIRLSGCGAFPSAAKPQVLWAGVEDEAGGLAALYSLLGEKLGAAGFAVETRPFAAHLTLGRVKAASCVALAASALEKEGAFSSAYAEVDAVELMESKLSAQGPAYSVLARVELAG